MAIKRTSTESTIAILAKPQRRFSPLFKHENTRQARRSGSFENQWFVAGSCNIFELSSDDICLLLHDISFLFVLSQLRTSTVSSRTSSVRSRLFCDSRSAFGVRGVVEKLGCGFATSGTSKLLYREGSGGGYKGGTTGCEYRRAYTYTGDVHRASSCPHHYLQAVLKLRMAIPSYRICGLKNLLKTCSKHAQKNLLALFGRGREGI